MYPRLGEVLRIRGEVLEGRIDPAVSLGRVAAALLHGEDAGWLGRPREFLERTHITGSMRRVLLSTAARLAGRPRLGLGGEVVEQSSVVLLPSMLGGGKTHLMAFLLHVVEMARRGEIGELASYDPELASALSQAAGALEGVRVSVIVGDQERFAPTDARPVVVNGVRVETVWDLMAAQLGSGVEPLGWREAPSVDYLRDKVLAGRPTLIVIDEIVSYLGKLDEGRRDQVVTFLRNLFQAADESPRTVVVISLPAEVSGEALGRVEHDATIAGRSLVRDIYNNAKRVYPLVVQPLDADVDIVMVLRKRLLENSVEELEEAGRRVASIVGEMVEGDNTFRRAMREAVGSERMMLARIPEAYPFHPLLIKTLLDMGSVIPGFRRTRGLIEIVMDLLIDMTRTGALDKQALIMPWNIRVERDEVRVKILASHERRDYYSRVLRNDVEAARETMGEEPVRLEAALRIIRTAWLYSVALGTLANLRDMIERAPRLEALPAYIMEPTDRGTGLNAGYIISTARDMADLPKFQVVYYEGKLLYPILPDIDKIVRERYESAAPTELYREFGNKLSRLEGQRAGFAHVAVILSKHKHLQQAISTVRRVEDPTLVIYGDLQEELTPGEAESLLPRNNSALLQAQPRKTVEEVPTAAQLADSISRSYPYIGKPRTLLELAEEIYRLLDAIEAALNDIEIMHDRDTAIIAREKLGEAQRLVRSHAQKILPLLFPTLKAGAGGKKEIVMGSMGQIPDLASLPERAWDYFTSKARSELDWSLLVDTLRVLGKVGAEPRLGVQEAIVEPVEVGVIWGTLLNSRDERIGPHTLTRRKLVEDLHRIYQEHFEQIAFLGVDGRVYWLKPQQVEEGDLEGGMINPGTLGHLRYTSKYSLEDIKPVLMSKDGSLRGSIVHPIVVVDRLIRSLLEEQEKPLRRGGVEVYRKYYLVSTSTLRVEELDRFYTLYKGDEARLYKGLVDAIIVYTEREVEKTYTATLLEPQAQEPLRYKRGEAAEVKIRVKVESQDYPHPIEVYARIVDGEGREAAREKATVNRVGLRRVSEEVELAVKAPEEPGEYIVEVLTRGLYPRDNVERKIGSIKLVREGYTCTRRTVPAASLGEALEGAARARLLGAKIQARPGVGVPRLKASLRWLMSLLTMLDSAGARYDAELSAAAGDTRIEFTLRNAGAQEVARSLRAFIDVAEAANARIEALRLHARIMGGPQDPSTLALEAGGAGDIVDVELEVEECREVKVAQ